MSRIGKKPVPVGKAKVTVKDQNVSVEGPKGKLELKVHPLIKVASQEGNLVVTRPDDEKQSKALHGLTRALLANMIQGVTEGYKKTLEIQGVGYKAEMKPFGVNLIVGYSHQVPYKAPAGIKISVENNTVVKIEGADTEKVGQVAAELRLVRPPEPYKGKGIRYQGEQVRRKAGKTGAK
jgi:large subunit ribosomal protein L6